MPVDLYAIKMLEPMMQPSDRDWSASMRIDSYETL